MKVHIKKVCLAVFCIWGLAICAEALAYTEVCGHIEKNTTWVPDGSPYVLICKVIIDPNVALTIEPDVVVVSTSLGSKPLAVRGSLEANGASFPKDTPDYPGRTYSANIHVEDNGSVGLSDCGITGYVHFQPGGSGTVAMSTIHHLFIEGDGNRTISGNNTIGYIQFVSAGDPAATITKNTFTNDVPFWIEDPDLNASGITGNYYEPNSRVCIYGELDDDKTLSDIDGLWLYEIPYFKYTPFSICSNAILTIRAPVQLHYDSGAELFKVQGSLDADGVYFSMYKISVEDGGSVDMKNCSISRELLCKSGSHTTVWDCNISGFIDFQNDSNGIIEDSNIGYVTFYGVGTRKMFGNRVGHINLCNDAMAGCMASNNITESGPFRIINGIGDTSGICNNIYNEDSDPNILISGNFKSDCTVGFIDGMGDYRIDVDLNINSGSIVTFARDTRFEAKSRKLRVEGSMVANGVMFLKNINILVNEGGSAKLWHCDMNDATVSIDCQSGSSGILEYCRLNQLDIDSRASFSIVNNDFSYSSVNGIVSVPGNPDDVIDMNDNWWGTIDANEIEEKILHHPDDEPPIRPWVGYEPFLQEPLPDTIGAGDFEPDGDVDLFDFAYFAEQWSKTNCGCSNWCGGADLDHSWHVDFADLAIFVDNWLAGL